jgi:hypothetical protein
MSRSTSSPLAARKSVANPKKRGQYYDQEEDPTFVPWAMKKKDILTVYTTDEAVGIQMVLSPSCKCKHQKSLGGLHAAHTRVYHVSPRVELHGGDRHPTYVHLSRYSRVAPFIYYFFKYNII